MGGRSQAIMIGQPHGDADDDIHRALLRGGWPPKITRLDRNAYFPRPGWVWHSRSRAGRSTRKTTMATDINSTDTLSVITQRIVETYEECGAIHHLGHSPLPSYREIVDILADLREILYPGYGRRQNLHLGNVAYHVGDLIDGLNNRLTQQIARGVPLRLQRPRRRGRPGSEGEGDRDPLPG